ncbi:bifunctional 23S rRNA (guanine(2069)-N(7))-methyltransferase RlmK/23S rRNA (guanine(2445)-N(2))-methyltransferase RlmL [Buchnera aphidicola]|uniref:bifunctional 23S rRNA (guanine(2069)-N(7))-methyltransferase RlmK/23S rRNA (guanine(2445)-N(2))-methyltransferase RlmL n=1 Tax=Buchnera aphidicola TaxID=9 RepID=UPI0034640647
MNDLFISTIFGCEDLLEKELNILGATNLKLIKGGIYCSVNKHVLYNILMWSRIASRVFLCIKNFSIQNSNDLYTNIYNIEWNTIFHHNDTFMIRFKGTNNIIRNTLFGTFIIKDAIMDYFYKKEFFRPIVNRVSADICITAFLFKNVVHIMLNLSGDALHQRGYSKISKNITPIKENLGMAIVLRSGWNFKSLLIDPMCGSGTLLIEAAMFSSDRAPGLKRKKWGFQNWKNHDKKIWENTQKEALYKFEIGIKTCKQIFLGYDYNKNCIKEAKIHALNAGVDGIIQFSQKNINDFKNIFEKNHKGTILSNPPYGERHKTKNQVAALYIQIGFVSQKHFHQWNISIFSSSIYLLNFIQMPFYKKFFYKNGPLNCIQRNYIASSSSDDTCINEYKNRLNKNFKKFKKWKFLNNIDCFRVYNADLPNYNIIIDLYKNWMVIQEYEAPKEINPEYAHKRLCQSVYYAKKILSIPINNIILKLRKKQKKGKQYEKFHHNNNFFEIQEYNLKFLVNLTDYLDTGIFFDKRLIRKLITNISYGKDFLNLFSYTGTASVAAASGGARSTTTIDISKTYIKWSMKNMSINHFTSNNHIFIQQDCLDWLKISNKKFDLIFVNPPTFSNSKKMKKFFYLKKDYLILMIHLKKILKNDGKIIFSSSTHNFDINIKHLNAIKLYAKNITKKITPQDMIKNIHVHHSWLITHI